MGRCGDAWWMRCSGDRVAAQSRRIMVNMRTPVRAGLAVAGAGGERVR